MTTINTTIRLALIAALLFPSPSPARETIVAAPENEARTLIFNAGAGSPRAWNYAGVTKEYLLDDHSAFFVTGGLGTALIGAGYVYYSNREGNGIVVSSAVGIVDLQATLAYQWQVQRNDFIYAGGSYGMFFMQCYCWLPLLGYEHRY
jgi:hypothetical protein